MLMNAAQARFSETRDNQWKASLPEGEAQDVVRQMLLTPQDQLVDEGSAAVRRLLTPMPTAACRCAMWW